MFIFLNLNSHADVILATKLKKSKKHGCIVFGTWQVEETYLSKNV